MQPTLRQDDFMERAMRTWGSTVYRLALNQTQSDYCGPIATAFHA